MYKALVVPVPHLPPMVCTFLSVSLLARSDVYVGAGLQVAGGTIGATMMMTMMGETGGAAVMDGAVAAAAMAATAAASGATCLACLAAAIEPSVSNVTQLLRCLDTHTYMTRFVGRIRSFSWHLRIT